MPGGIRYRSLRRPNPGSRPKPGARPRRAGAGSRTGYHLFFTACDLPAPVLRAVNDAFLEAAGFVLRFLTDFFLAMPE